MDLNLIKQMNDFVQEVEVKSQQFMNDSKKDKDELTKEVEKKINMFFDELVNSISGSITVPIINEKNMYPVEIKLYSFENVKYAYFEAGTVGHRCLLTSKETSMGIIEVEYAGNVKRKLHVSKVYPSILESKTVVNGSLKFFVENKDLIESKISTSIKKVMNERLLEARNKLSSEASFLEKMNNFKLCLNIE